MIFRRLLSSGKEKMETPDTASGKQPAAEVKPEDKEMLLPKSEEEEPKSEEVKVQEEKKPVEEEEPGKAEEVKVEEPVAAEAAAPAKETLEASSLPSFKEESYHVHDLKESEKKALAEFSDKVEAAIKANEFVLPPPIVETVKATVVAQGNEEATVVAATVETEVKEGDVVVDKAEDAAVALVTPEGISVVPVELPIEEASKVGEAAPSETPKEEAAPSEAPKEEAALSETPKEEPAPSEAPKEESVPSEAPEAPTEVSKEVAAPAEAEATPSEAPKEESVPTEAPKEKGAIEEAAPEAKAEEVPPTTEVVPEAPAAETPAVTEEKEKEAPPPADLDLELWGVPLLPSKGDPRTQVVFLKFLRARDFKVKEAFTMLKDAILWRKKYGADKLVEEELGSDFHGTAFNHGVDKEGHPVQYNVFGSLEGKALGEAALRWRIQLLEKEIRKLSFSPGGVSSLLQVFDLKDAPLLSNKALRQFLSQAIMCMLDNYPELVVKIVFLNTPWYYSALYTFVSPFLTQRTKSKLVFGSSLFKYISPDNIPVQYGGLGRVNDTEFGEGNVPVSELAIKAGERQTIDIEVTAAGATVVWDVAIVGADVTYGAEFVPKKEGGYTTVVEKPKKVAVLEEPIRNTFKAMEPGKLVLTIDNSSSRKKKNAVHRYVVKPPAAAAAAAE